MQEKRWSASWRKQLWNAQISLNSQVIEAYTPLTTKGRATMTLSGNIQTKLFKPRLCWEELACSFWHHNSHGSTCSGNDEYTPSTTNRQAINGRIERKPIPTCFFEFFSNMSVNPTMIGSQEQTIITHLTTARFLSSAAAQRFQNGHPVLVNAKLSQLRTIPIEHWLLLIIVNRALFEKCLNSLITYTYKTYTYKTLVSTCKSSQYYTQVLLQISNVFL